MNLNFLVRYIKCTKTLANKLPEDYVNNLPKRHQNAPFKNKILASRPTAGYNKTKERS